MLNRPLLTTDIVQVGWLTDEISQQESLLNQNVLYMYV